MAEINLFQQRLDAFDRAVGAIEDGTYGTCGRCGSAIAPERLVATPMAQTCLTCQEKADAQQHTDPRQ